MTDNRVRMENSPRLFATAQFSPTLRGVELSLWHESIGFTYLEYVTAFVVEQVEPGVMVAPSCLLEGKAAQRLMDDLWRAGFRPADNQNPNETMQAMREHIASLKAEVMWLRHMCEGDDE